MCEYCDRWEPTDEEEASARLDKLEEQAARSRFAELARLDDDWRLFVATDHDDGWHAGDYAVQDGVGALYRARVTHWAVEALVDGHWTRLA